MEKYGIHKIKLKGIGEHKNKGPMLLTAGGAINETSRVETPDHIRESELGITLNYLTPAFIVDDLESLLATISP